MNAVTVTDAGELSSVAEGFVLIGWPAEVAGDALTAECSVPSAGAAPWYVYRAKPSTVFALGTSQPFGATTFQLG